MQEAIPIYMEGDKNEGDNNGVSNNNNDGTGPVKRRADAQDPDNRPLPWLDDEWDEDKDYDEEACCIDIEEESVMPSNWHGFCMAQKENFPYVSAIYEENFNSLERRVNLNDAQDRMNFYLSPTCLEVIRKAYFVAHGRYVKRIKFVPEMNVDFPLLLYTDAYQRAAFRARLNDPNRRCYACTTPLPQLPIEYAVKNADPAALLNHPKLLLGSVELLRCPEETDDSYRFRTTVFYCEPCFDRRYRDLVMRSYMRYVTSDIHYRARQSFWCNPCEKTN